MLDDLGRAILVELRPATDKISVILLSRNNEFDAYILYNVAMIADEEEGT